MRMVQKLVTVGMLLSLAACGSMQKRQEFALYDRNMEVANYSESPYAFLK